MCVCVCASEVLSGEKKESICPPLTCLCAEQLVERWFWQGRLILSSCHYSLLKTAYSLTPQTLPLSLCLLFFFFFLHTQGNSDMQTNTHAQPLSPTQKHAWVRKRGLSMRAPRQCGNEGTSLQTLTLPFQEPGLYLKPQLQNLCNFTQTPALFFFFQKLFAENICMWIHLSLSPLLYLFISFEPSVQLQTVRYVSVILHCVFVVFF